MKSVGYIDSKMDTLVVNDFESILSDLGNFGFHLDLSGITSVAISGILNRDESLHWEFGSLSKSLESAFPNLKRLFIILNHALEHPLGSWLPCGRQRLFPADDPNLLVDIQSAIESQRPCRYYLQEQELADLQQIDTVVENPALLCHLFQEQARKASETGTPYWDTIKIESSFMGKWVQDKDAFALKKEISLNGKRLFTFAPRDSGVIRLDWRNNTYFIQTDGKGYGNLYEGIRGLFEGYDSAITSNKYLRWPWNHEPDVAIQDRTALKW